MAADRGSTLVVRGPIMLEDVPVLCRRASELLESSRAELMICDVGAVVDPDATTVEALARLQLTVLRLGSRVRFRYPCRELQELVAFMGLRDVLG
jgi:ABC-type transporter Mla MlaB component